MHPALKQIIKDKLWRPAAKTGRQLRGHGLIRKIPKTPHDQLTDRGRQLGAALFAIWKASIKQLLAMVA